MGSADGPRLLFWQAGEREAVAEYGGPLKFNALLEWLEAAIGGDIREAEKPKETNSTSFSSTKAAETQAAETEDAAARRARLQAKMDEIERRDRLRREREAAKKAAEDEEAGGTPVEDAPAAEPEPVEPPAAEPEEVAEDNEVATPGVTHTHPVAREAGASEPTEGTPLDAPPAEPAEAADETEAADWNEWPESSTDTPEHARDEL